MTTAVGAGVRPNATRLPFTISDKTSLAVDVGTGNALVTHQMLSLPGVTADVPVAITYNSLLRGTTAASAVTGTTGSGWSISGFDQRMEQQADGSVRYRGDAGLTGVFTPITGGFTAPAGIKATLAQAGSTWTLTDHQSQSVARFATGSGRLDSVTDRNGNVTSFTYGGTGAPASIVSSRGTTAARTLTVVTSSGRITALQQGTSGGRQWSFTYSASTGTVTVGDSMGKTVTFTSTAAAGLTQVSNPDGKTTALEYLSAGSGVVTKVTQANTAPGSPGSSVTRLAYPSSSQTLVADPTTDQAQPVASVPRTTYALTADNTGRVGQATDPLGNVRAATYTTGQDVASSTASAGTAGAGTTSFAYGANGGESLTGITRPGGSTSTAAYGNTPASSVFSPSSLTSDEGNATTLSYNGTGNQLSSSDASAAVAAVTYNTDGTVATATAEGNPYPTTYAYNATTRNLTTITAPAGTSLGARNYTFDDFGRLATATDGISGTITYTYTYDKTDHLTRIDYSDVTTTDIVYTYDNAGRVSTRVDASGTTTYLYTDLGQVRSITNTAGGGTISYTYEKDGSLATTVDSRGTITYAYNTGRQLVSMKYGTNASNITRFTYDNAGRRTGSYLQATNGDLSTWAARTQTTYDTSGRVTRITGDLGPAATYTRVFDQQTCYAAGSVAPACSASTSVDRTSIRWVKDYISGETTTYSYDTQSRLTGATIAGGSNPRTYSYTYDSRGNRLTAGQTGSSPTNQTLTYDAANKVTTSGYGHDGAGNLTTAPGRTTTYNTSGQQTTATIAGATTTYTYAGPGQNELTRGATAGGLTVDYAYGRTDRNGLPVIEQFTRTSGGTSQTAYVEHDNNGTPVMLRTSSGVESLYIYDGRGNPIGLVTSFAVTAFAYDYDPYGSAVLTVDGGGAGPTQNPYLYGGGLQDRATGLIKFGARWYDPATGRFTQQDALDAPLDPFNANRYAYSASDPINNADPTGLASRGACIGGAIGIVGAGLSFAGAVRTGNVLGALGTGATIVGLTVFQAYECHSENVGDPRAR